MEEEVDLKVIFDALWSKKVIIIVITIIFAILGIVYSKVLITPKYTATANMILVSNSSTTESGTPLTTSDISLNNNLIGTYKEVARSNSVVRAVLDNLQIKDLSEETLKSMINVTTITNSQMLYISITDVDPYRAAKITNELTKVFSDKIQEIYRLDNISVVDEAEVPTHTSNINTKRTMAIFAIIGLVLSVAMVLLINSLDNTIKTSKDIEKAIRVPVLAELPQCDFTENSVKRRRK